MEVHQLVSECGQRTSAQMTGKDGDAFISLSEVDVEEDEAEELSFAEACPQLCSLVEWYNIFDKYGTHFLSTVHLGGKQVSEVRAC